MAAILLAIYAPAKAFLMLYGVAVAGTFFVWIIILLTHLAFRRALAPERIARLPMRLRFFPYSTWLGITALLGIAVSTFYVQGLQYSVPAFAPILLLISLAYWKIRRGKGLRAIWSASNLAPQRIFWYGQKLALVTALNQHSLLCSR